MARKSSNTIASMSLADKKEDIAFRPSVVIPYPAPRLMDLDMFQGDQKKDLYWGTYRPQAYFGLRARDSDPLVAGLMWLVKRDGQPLMRHFCEDTDDLKSFGWKEHNGIDFGRQVLQENEMTLETSFVKSKHGSLGYGGDWSVRIDVENTTWLDDETDRNRNLFFYIADEALNPLHLGFRNSSILAYGSRENDVGNWQLHFSSADDPDYDLNFNYCGFKASNTVDLSDRVLTDLNQSTSGLQLSNTAETGSNVYVFQITMTAPKSTIDIAFISGIEDKTSEMKKRTEELTGLQLSRLLEEKHSAYDEKFRQCYNLSGKVDYDSLMVGKAAIANMLGGIGYFYGSSKIAYPNKYGFIENWEAGLYTVVPCRPKFPWGFLWDEGFHQMLIWRWDLRITLEILGHWLDLMNMDGWIPREQILGDDALSKIRWEYVIQKPDIANPPTLILVLSDLIKNLNKFTKKESSDIKTFLERGFVRLNAWFGWLHSTQKGKEEGSFYWRGRDGTTDHELNPRTLASGMDDYPRASDPSDDEKHVDLRCWIYLAADSMKSIAVFLSKPEAVNAYTLIVKELSDFDALNEMHYDHELETYLDYGNHTEKVQLSFEHGQLVRIEGDEPKLSLVPHVGYNSFFPFISKLIPSNSVVLKEQLILISDESKVWSDYGLLSLSKTSSLYMKWNGLNQKPYWRGPIWLNLNYLILSSLHHYSQVVGSPYSKMAGEIYEKLRNNLISNVVGNYDKTGFIWEQYDQTKGTGKGGRDFTGWSSLILLIMSEEYPSFSDGLES